MTSLLRNVLVALACAGAAGWLLGSASHAATLTGDLNIDHCTGTCGLTDYGDVTVTDTATGVTFTVQLQNGAAFQFAGAGLNTFSFGFSGSALTSSDVTNITLAGATLAFVAPSSNQDGFGDFLYAVNSDGPPNQSTQNALLTFDVLGKTVAELVTSLNGSPNVLFAADIFGPNSKTGLVGFTTSNCTVGAGCGPPPGTVPLPGSLPLLGSVLAGGWWFGRRSRKRRNRTKL